MSVTAPATRLAGAVDVWTDVYLLRRFVEMLKDELLLARFAEDAIIPKNTGGYVARWMIPQSFKGSTTVLTEAGGGTGAATFGERTTTTISASESTINTYGEFMKIGEIAKGSMIPATMDAFSEQFAFAGASAIDSLLLAAAVTTTNFMHSGEQTTGGATLAADDYATIVDFRTISNFFYGKNAKGFKSLGGDFVWIMHPNQELKIGTEFTTSSMTWVDTNKHTESGWKQNVDNHRIVGRWSSVTALRTTMIGTVNEDITAFQSIALARFGVGWAGLGERGPVAPEIIRKSPGSNDTSQPLNMYDTIAWKVKMAAALLDANRALIVYSDSD